MSDIRQSLEFSKYLEKLEWKTDECRIHNSEFRIFIRKIPLLGNFVKIHHPFVPLSDNNLKELAKKYKAFSVQVTYSPAKTLVMDLKPSLEKIFDGFSKDTRYEIRKAQENGVVIKQTEDISVFVKMWTETALRRHFWIPFEKEIVSLYKAFGNKAVLIMSYGPIPNSQFPLSGALVLFNNKTAHYFHAASTIKGRQLQAPSLVLQEAIKLAKKEGCTSFDFEGIFDPRDKDTKSWQGFTRFKKGFGGKEIEYPLTKTLFFNPILSFFNNF